MRESDIPPPGDPSMRGSRIFGLVIIAVILVFIVWFAAENWTRRDPGNNPTVPTGQSSGDQRR
ncbi:MAG TPA: hypothetical protein VE871_18015 [Longimicrobium sp.]|nr:hypothetical protein [Longimicrobium sp.]